jgi:methylmalonyl-CoA mutase
MPDVDFNLKDDFPPASYEQWRAFAEADLKGASFQQKLVTHTYEGIDIQPLYTRRDELGPREAAGLPGEPPFVRSSRPLGAVADGWDLRQEHVHPDLTDANHAIIEDLEGGVTSIELRLDSAARDGLDPDDPATAQTAGRDGLMAYSLADLDGALAGVRLELVGISLDAGAAFLPAAALLVALWQRRGLAANQVRGAFNADPWGVLAREGELPYSPLAARKLLADLAAWTAKNYPRATAVGADTSAYHAAGATAAQDVAFAIATGVEYLRGMTEGGLDIDSAARQILFKFSLGTHHFLAISKLRAARRLWSRVVYACGGSPAAGAMRIHARTGRRVLTRRDPYVNLLRNTAGVFAAGLGGAESITSVPFDAPIGLPSDLSRRIARNTLLILEEEGHLHRVVDPAGGSWFLERLTQQIAERAWGVFQEVERQGGMLAALRSGWICSQIESSFAPRAKDIARRKEGITGVSEFPDVGQEPVRQPTIDVSALREAAAKRVAGQRRASPFLAQMSEVNDRTATTVAAAADGASIGQVARALGFHEEPFEAVPVELRSFAGPFEELRDASDVWTALHGKRPTVFLANMGPVSHHTARATFSKNFFEAGGFDVLTNDGFRDADAAAKACAESKATIAVICSSDKLYPEMVPQVAGKLKSAGARTVVLAGNPGANEEAWRAAGVDRFIFIKCDVLATLREMLAVEGVVGEDEGGKPEGERRAEAKA